MDESIRYNIEMNVSHSIYFKFVRIPHQELDFGQLISKNNKKEKKEKKGKKRVGEIGTTDQFVRISPKNVEHSP